MLQPAGLCSLDKLGPDEAEAWRIPWTVAVYGRGGAFGWVVGALGDLKPIIFPDRLVSKIAPI